MYIKDMQKWKAEVTNTRLIVKNAKHGARRIGGVIST
jgi:hypothetical protein